MDTNERPRPVPQLVVFLAMAALVGALTSLVTTRNGVGLSPDSAVYLGSATSLIEGDGLRVPFKAYPRGRVEDPLVRSEPLTNFPPAYPVLVAGVSKLTGTEPRTAARGIDALGLAVMVALAGWVLHRYSGGGLLVPGVGVLLLLSSLDVLLIASSAWSELLFIVLAMGAMVLLVKHLERPSWWALAGCSLLASLSALTRFVGLAVILTAAMSLVALSSQPRRRRLGEAALVGAVSTVPAAVWAIAATLGSGEVGNRALAFHPRFGTSLRGSLNTLAAWLVKEARPTKVWDGRLSRALNPLAELPAPLGVLVMMAAIALVAVAAVRARRPVPAQASLTALPKVLAVFIASYGLFLLLTIWFVDAGVSRLDLRLLSPVHVAALLAVMAVAARCVDVPKLPRPARALAVVVVGLFLAPATVSVAVGPRFSGQYARPKWQRSPIMAAVQALPADRVLVTNSPGPLWLLTGRSSASVPERFSLVTRRTNRRLGAELAELTEAMRARRALLVWVNDSPDDSHLPDRQELEVRLGLRPVREEPDGTIYEAPG